MSPIVVAIWFTGLLISLSPLWTMYRSHDVVKKQKAKQQLKVTIPLYSIVTLFILAFYGFAFDGR